MARYKIRVPEAGTFLHDDSGCSHSVVAESIEEARELLEVFEVHPQIGRCYYLTKAMIEDGEGLDDSEPGDTMVAYLPFEDRDLGSAECLVWETGPPAVRGWSTKPIGFQHVGIRNWPMGIIFCTDSWHPDDTAERRHYEFRLLGTRPAAEGWEVLAEEIEFGHPRQETGTMRTLHVQLGDALWISGFSPWKPEGLYELEIQGETAEGSQEEMEALRKWVQAEADAQWRAELWRVEPCPVCGTLVRYGEGEISNGWCEGHGPDARRLEEVSRG